MPYKLLFIYLFFINIYARSHNKFIIDYFDYKKVSSVVGFSCNIDEDDLLLVKLLNQKGILTAINKLNNETQINLIARTEHQNLGIFLDTHCYDLKLVTSIFLKASEYRMYDELHSWLILGSDLNNTLTLIDDSTFSVVTEFVIAVMSDTGDDELYDVYNPMKDRGSVLNVTFMSNWNEETGLNITLKQEKFPRRCNLHRIIIKVMFFQFIYKPANMPVDEYLDDFATATKDARSKFGHQLMKYLGDLYNFSLENSESTKWDENDTLGPLSRSVANNEADITGSLSSFNMERSYILKFVHYDWPFRTCFIFRNPQQTKIEIKAIFAPFEMKIWYLIILLIIIFVIFLSKIVHFERSDNNILLYTDSFLITIGALCQQATELKMKQISTRLVFLFIMIFSVLIYNCYSASIVSARIRQPVLKIKDSLYEFSKLNFKISSEDMVYIHFAFNDPDWQVQDFYSNHWLKLPKSKRFMPPEEGVPLVQKGGFAYHTHPDVSYPIIDTLFNHREICELNEVNLIHPNLAGFAVPYNSSITELYRVGFTKIAESGLTHRELLRWNYRKPKCRKDILSISNITIYEFSPILILLGLGILLSIIICGIEVFIANNINKKL